jgi:hypothetical protein
VKRYGRIVTSVAAIVVAAAVVFIISSRKTPEPVIRHMTYNRSRVETLAMRPEFFDAAGFRRALASAEREVPSSEIGGVIRAIIVPHHLLASSMIASTFRRASGRPAKKVVIVGPNHRGLGGADLTTARACWQAAQGRLCADDGLVSGLVAATGASSNVEVFRDEHSIGAIVPFAARYFPDIPVVPVIVHVDASWKSIQDLSAWLIGLEDAVIVFSIDFSHYLTRAEAEKKDAMTRDVIEAGDAEQAFALGGAHVDSAGSLATALLAARQAGWEIGSISHANADDFLAMPAAETTSYFSVIFRDGGQPLLK